MTRSTRPSRSPERARMLAELAARRKADRRSMRIAARRLVGWTHSR